MASRKADGEPSSPAAVPKPKGKRYTIIRLAEIGGLKAKEKRTFTQRADAARRDVQHQRL